MSPTPPRMPRRLPTPPIPHPRVAPTTSRRRCKTPRPGSCGEPFVGTSAPALFLGRRVTRLLRRSPCQRLPTEPWKSRDPATLQPNALLSHDPGSSLRFPRALRPSTSDIPPLSIQMRLRSPENPPSALPCYFGQAVWKRTTLPPISIRRSRRDSCRVRECP